MTALPTLTQLRERLTPLFGHPDVDLVVAFGSVATTLKAISTLRSSDGSRWISLP